MTSKPMTDQPNEAEAVAREIVEAAHRCTAHCHKVEDCSDSLKAATGRVLPIITRLLSQRDQRIAELEKIRDRDYPTLADWDGLKAQVAALQAERERATSLNDYFRDAVGECHMMISRNTSEYQVRRREWEATDLPPRVQKLMRRTLAAEGALDEAKGLLRKAQEWAAGYPLQGSGSHADHGAANDVYQSIRAFLDPEAKPSAPEGELRSAKAARIYSFIRKHFDSHTDAGMDRDEMYWDALAAMLYAEIERQCRYGMSCGSYVINGRCAECGRAVDPAPQPEGGEAKRVPEQGECPGVFGFPCALERGHLGFHSKLPAPRASEPPPPKEEEATLLPCPECGNAPTYDHQAVGVAVECENCGMRTAYVQGLDGCAWRWNCIARVVLKKPAPASEQTGPSERPIWYPESLTGEPMFDLPAGHIEMKRMFKRIIAAALLSERVATARACARILCEDCKAGDAIEREPADYKPRGYSHATVSCDAEAIWRAFPEAIPGKGEE